MTRLENPVLTHELRNRLHATKLIPAIVLRCACLGLIFLLMLQFRLGRGFLAFILAETFLVLLFTPGAVCSAFAGSIGRRDFRDLVLTRLSSPAILLGKLAAADLYTCMIIVFSGVVICVVSLFRSDLHIWRFVCANAALLVLLFSCAALGMAFSMAFRRNSLAAYVLAYTLIFLLISSVIISGPIIDRIQSAGAKTWIKRAALHANPLVMTSRSLGTIDLMRTRYIYVLAEPIVTRGFTYPNWYSIAAIYLAISCLLLIPVFVCFRYRTRRPEGLLQGVYEIPGELI